MSIQLEPAIARYVELENAGDAEALPDCFAPNATVWDEGHTYQGLAVIKEWKVEAKKEYNHTVTPLEVVQRHGKTTLAATLAGDFPGSPVTVNFDFVLEDGKILSLEIQA